MKSLAKMQEFQLKELTLQESRQKRKTKPKEVEAILFDFGLLENTI